MLRVWWSAHGVKYWQLLDEYVAMTAELYVSQLQILKDHLQTTREEQAYEYSKTAS